MNNRNCFRNDAELNLYLDCELPAHRSAELAGHIGVCRPCLLRYEISRQLKHLLGRSQRTSRAPAELRDKIVSEIGMAAGRGTGIRDAIINFCLGRPLISIGAASSLAIIFTFFLFLKPPDQRNPELVRSMVGEHDEYIAEFNAASGVRSSDPAVISEWLSANHEAQVELSKRPGLPAIFGACAIAEGERHITCLLFGQSETRISLFIIPGEPDGFDGLESATLKNIPIYRGNCAGHNFVAWEMDGSLRLLVSRLPGENLLKMAEMLI